MHERRFSREIERLRDPDRVARLDVENVVRLALEGLVEAKAVLDEGTGSGLFAEQFAAQGMQVTGLDANPEMLPVAQQYVPAGTFQEGVAEQLPFPDQSFDLVFMGLLLHETDDALTAIQEARRVAKMRLAILEWPDEEQSFGPPHEHRLSADRVSSLAIQAGFHDAHAIRLSNLMLYLCNIV
jgi:ubiquinone/menaquinone biosynthesis C-methylase UbiE